MTGQLLAVFSVRRGFDWKMLWPFVAGGLAGVPLGVQLLPMLDMTWFKAVLGAILAIWCPTMLFAARLPRIKGSRVGDCAAGLVGGVMGGIGGFTGVVPTLWCTLCGFDKHAQRRHPELQSVDAGGDHADLSGHGHDHARHAADVRGGRARHAGAHAAGHAPVHGDLRSWRSAASCWAC